MSATTKKWVINTVFAVVVSVLSAASSAIAVSYQRGARDESYLTKDKAAELYVPQKLADERYSVLTGRLDRMESTMVTRFDAVLAAVKK